MPTIEQSIALVTLFAGLFVAYFGARAGKAAPDTPKLTDDRVEDILALMRRSDERLIEINAEVRGHTRTLDRIEGHTSRI